VKGDATSGTMKSAPIPQDVIDRLSKGERTPDGLIDR
jgi:hypothetical protein